MEALSRNLRLDVRDETNYCDAVLHMTNRQGACYRVDPRPIVLGIRRYGGSIAELVRAAAYSAARELRDFTLKEYHIRRASQSGGLVAITTICDVAAAIRKQPTALLLPRRLDEDCIEHPALATIYRFALREVSDGAFDPEHVDRQLRERMEARVLPRDLMEIASRLPDVFEIALRDLADVRRPYDPQLDPAPTPQDGETRVSEAMAGLREMLRSTGRDRKRIVDTVQSTIVMLMEAAAELDLYAFDTADNTLHRVLGDRHVIASRGFAAIRNSLWYESAMRAYYRLDDTIKSGLTKAYFQSTTMLAISCNNALKLSHNTSGLEKLEHAVREHLNAYDSLNERLTQLMGCGREN